MTQRLWIYVARDSKAVLQGWFVELFPTDSVDVQAMMCLEGYSLWEQEYSSSVAVAAAQRQGSYDVAPAYLIMCAVM